MFERPGHNRKFPTFMLRAGRCQQIAWDLDVASVSHGGGTHLPGIHYFILQRAGAWVVWASQASSIRKDLSLLRREKLPMCVFLIVHA
jgi:hypothetical protein